MNLVVLLMASLTLTADGLLSLSFPDAYVSLRMLDLRALHKHWVKSDSTVKLELLSYLLQTALVLTS
jgi:hypothetical protein